MSSDRPHVHGPAIDGQTRCIHYGTALDVIAIEFACCRRFYPCHLCHAADADHPAEQWLVSQRAERAILCGVCGHRLTIDEYSSAGSCPACAAPFNPGCTLHWNLYFDA